MSIFDNTAEKQRKQNLKELEDKRVAFAKCLAGAGLKSDRSLYSQQGGGFHGVAISGNQYVYITGPAPGEDGDFSMAQHSKLEVQTEEVHIPSEGMGGVLGFGKRGGLGYRLTLNFPDGTSGDIEMVSGMNCFFENDRGADPLFDVNRRRGDANFVWEFRPIEQAKVKNIVQRWLQALGDAI